MQGAAAKAKRRPTADEVLEFLRADYRVRSSIDPEVDGGEELARATPVANWRAANDLVPANRLAADMDAWLGTACGPEAWRTVLEPGETRTLGEVCDFAAAHATWDDFAPVRVGGVLNPASGAFFALRGMLAHIGIPVGQLRPSTPVDAIARSQLYPFSQAVARLAPNLVAVPQLTRSMLQRIGGVLFALTVLGFVWSIWHPSELAFGVVVLAVILGAGLSRTPYAAVKLGPYETFGDLARAIALTRTPR